MSAKLLLFAATLIAPQLLTAKEPTLKSKDMKPVPHQKAVATVTVQHSEAKTYDETAIPTLKELTLQETFTGDINGQSLVRALQISFGKDSASMTSVQRFRGNLADRKGTFVLQGSEVIKDGKIQATWFVVPDTGTEALTGLRGEGGFEGDFGKGSHAHLNYWFE